MNIDPTLGKKSADTIRMLAVDAVQKANSGHPGMPMGAADMAYVLWSRFLKFNPADPKWPGRDRFILSAGHGSMLQYALLHLFGFDLPMSELENFRQLHSKTPGHPEYGETPGVEVTTGPLGQGFANGVGMALAAKLTSARFTKDGFCPSSTRIFGIISDGDLMEGISYEAAAFAGHFKLGNLVYLYDSNRITIEGCTDLSWSENPRMRFEGAGWDVHEADGHDHEQIAQAISKATACTDKPSIVICHTHIAYGSPNKQDTCSSHGAPLGEDEVAATKKALNWPESPKFLVPEDVAASFAELTREKKATHEKWTGQFANWKTSAPDLFAAWETEQSRTIPGGLLQEIIDALADKDDATRNYSGVVLQACAKALPNLAGGSADLAPSNKTTIKDEPFIAPGMFHARNIPFGIREHAMGAIANGMCLYGGIIPYTGTFLVFADYMRPTIRMAALMKIPTIFVFTHDSFWVGEDGPTHQPIEQVGALRCIPNTRVFRPADGVETAAAWDAALRRKDGPSVLIMTRQKLARFARPAGFSREMLGKGAYLAGVPKNADCKNIILASGSEVPTCLGAQEILAGQGIDVAVVSVLCRELFDAQGEEYRKSLIPDGACVVAVEAGLDQGWWKYIRTGGVVGMDRFGISAPGKVLADYFGFVPEKIAEKIKALVC